MGVWVDRPTASWTTSALASTWHAEGTEDVALGDDGVAAEVEVKGLSVGDVGITSADGSGSVYHLAKLSDFDGNYTAAGTGATVAGGASASIMKNQNGVEIRLVSTTQGVKFTFGAAGVSMKAKKEPSASY